MDGAPSIIFRTLAKPDDAKAVRTIAESSGFFSAGEIDIASELIDDRLQRGETSDYRFIFADEDSQTVGFACFGHIDATRGSYDLYWIAVRDDRRGCGIGGTLLAQCEDAIRACGGSRIYVETSSRTQYEPTRTFYERNGYAVAAMLEDFYAPGDGKIILVKVLAGSAEPQGNRSV